MQRANLEKTRGAIRTCYGIHAEQSGALGALSTHEASVAGMFTGDGCANEMIGRAVHDVSRVRAVNDLFGSLVQCSGQRLEKQGWQIDADNGFYSELYYRTEKLGRE